MGNKATKKSKVPVIFDMNDQESIWSKAGVVSSRLCHNAFDCLSCSFDNSIQKKKTMGRVSTGLDTPARDYRTHGNWKRTATHERYCRHMLSGRVSFKLCVNGYDCVNCAYDQMQYDQALAEPSTRVRLTNAAGFPLPDNYYFHSGHTWARRRLARSKPQARQNSMPARSRLARPGEKFMRQPGTRQCTRPRTWAISCKTTLTRRSGINERPSPASPESF